MNLPGAALSLAPAPHSHAQRETHRDTGDLPTSGPHSPLTGNEVTICPRRQCRCSRNHPCRASPATSSSRRRTRLSRAALQACLRGLRSSFLNGMSVCPSTTNTEGRTTVSSMPAWMRPQMPRLGLHSWILRAGRKTTIAQHSWASHATDRHPWVLGPPLELWLGPSSFPLALLSFLSPHPRWPHLTLTHAVAHTFQRQLKM